MPRDRDTSWQSASPYLDSALDLPPAERAAWLADLRARAPELAADIEHWLAECDALAEADFLESASAIAPSRSGLSDAELGAYRLLSPIGHGGMGSVWLAERADGRFEGKVAVKLLNAALVGRSGEERFAREGRILARLAHPQIAHLVDAGVTPVGQPYLVLEYVDGEPIDAYCDRRRLGIGERIRLFLEVLVPIAHAHANLVVHRDLKPSNVLVTADGHVKLLDFGISRLLDDPRGRVEATLTRDGDTVLTPAYAAPEQVQHGDISTGTDIYALGVLLYVLLAGRHPAAQALDGPAELLHAIVHVEPPRMSELATSPDQRLPGTAEAIAAARGSTPAALRRALRGDLDVIAAHALAKTASQRYASVGELGQDLRRHLSHEPIAARAEGIASRAAKFARRHRGAVAAAAMILVGLLVGLIAVSRERAIAERRFDQVRALANKLFDIDVAVRQLPGATATRQVIVNTALGYLEGLTDGVANEPDLALDIGTAYMRVGRVQGVPISANLGQPIEADRTLATAERLIAAVLGTEPANQTAMLRAAQIAHDRMILAGERRADDEALSYARQSAAWLEKWAASGPLPAWLEVEQALIAYNNVGNRFRIVRDFAIGLQLVEQGAALARQVGTPAADRQRAALLITVARIHRDRGELDEALEAIREAQQVMEAAGPDILNNTGPRTIFVLMLNTEGELLGQSSGPNLGRPADAVVPLRRGFALMDELVHRDAANTQARNALASIGRPLAECLATTNPAEALSIYDHILSHLAEVRDNPRSRREEVRTLAYSTDPLRQLGRWDEVRRRLDEAFERLAGLKQYPADQIASGSEAEAALSAKADTDAARGGLAEAIAGYESLLALVLASKPEHEVDLGDATGVSRLFERLAQLNARAGNSDRAADYRARSRELWQSWKRVLPGSAFVGRQLAAAGAADVDGALLSRTADRD